MSQSEILKNFDFEDTPVLPSELMEEELEDAKLKSFENGYSAGWEDSEKARRTEIDRLVKALQEARQDSELTLENACEIVSGKYRTILEEVFRKLSGIDFAASLATALTTNTGSIEHLASGTEIHLSQTDFDTLAGNEIFAKLRDMTCADTTLSPGQGRVRHRDGTTEYHFPRMIDALSALIDQMTPIEQDRTNG